MIAIGILRYEMKVAFAASPLPGRQQNGKTGRCSMQRRALTRLCVTSGNEADRDWREVRAILHAGSEQAFRKRLSECHRAGHWAHPLSLPETGCYLASHPALFRRDAPYLTQSVVFLIEHCAKRGATGLVLNRPLRGSLNSLLDGGVITVDDDRQIPQEALNTLNGAHVYLGGTGNYEGSPLILLEGTDASTRHPSRAWAEPRAGVQVAALDTAFRGRPGTPSDPPREPMRVFAGCVKWGAGRLEAEVDSGEWFVFSASTKYATEHCIQLAKPLWREIMESTGEPFAKIARQAYGDD